MAKKAQGRRAQRPSSKTQTPTAEGALDPRASHRHRGLAEAQLHLGAHGRTAWPPRPRTHTVSQPKAWSRWTPSPSSWDPGRSSSTSRRWTFAPASPWPRHKRATVNLAARFLDHLIAHAPFPVRKPVNVSGSSASSFSRGAPSSTVTKDAADFQGRVLHLALTLADPRPKEA